MCDTTLSKHRRNTKALIANGMLLQCNQRIRSHPSWTVRYLGCYLNLKQRSNDTFFVGLLANEKNFVIVGITIENERSLTVTLTLVLKRNGTLYSLQFSLYFFLYLLPNIREFVSSVQYTWRQNKLQQNWSNTQYHIKI